MMPKLSALLLGLVLILIGLGLTAFLASDFLLDRPQVRRFLVTQAEEATGWNWRIGSGPRIRWQPLPQISLGQLELQAPDRPEQPHLHAEQAQIALRWESLLSTRPQPASIHAQRVTGELSATAGNAAGQNQGPLRFTLAEVQVHLEDAAIKGPTGHPLVRELRIEGGELTWKALAPGQDVSIKALSLSAGPLDHERSAGLRAQGIVTGELAALDAGWSTRMQLHAEREPITESGILELRTARLAFSDIRWKTAAGQSVWPEVELTGDVRINQSARRLALTNAQAQVQGLVLRGHLNASLNDGSPSASGRVTVDPFDLHAWLLGLGLKQPPSMLIATEQGFRALAVGFDFEANATALRAPSIWMKLDDSEAWGQASLDLGEHLTALFALSVDQLNLDRYLPAGTFDRPQPPPAVSDAGANAPMAVTHDVTPPFIGQMMAVSAPLSSPAKTPPATEPSSGPTTGIWQNLEASGDLNIQQLSLFKLRAGAVRVQPKLRGGRLTADFEAPDFYAGQIGGYLQLVPVNETAAEVKLLTKGEGLQIAPLLADLQTGMAVSGAVEIGLELNARGGDYSEIAQSLGGDLAVLLGNVRFDRMPLSALLAASGFPTNAKIELPPLDTFSEISASFKGENGTFRTSDVIARSPAVVISGTGLVELPARRLDFDLAAILQDTPDGRGIKELNGLPMPIGIKGDWQAPKVEFDPGPALREAATRAIDEKLRQHSSDLRKLEERTGIKGLEQGLRQLLGTD